MSLHYISDPSLKRPDYYYKENEDGSYIGWPAGSVEVYSQPWLWRVKAWFAAAIRALKDKP